MWYLTEIWDSPDPYNLLMMLKFSNLKERRLRKRVSYHLKPESGMMLVFEDSIQQRRKVLHRAIVVKAKERVVLVMRLKNDGCVGVLSSFSVSRLNSLQSVLNVRLNIIRYTQIL